MSHLNNLALEPPETCSIWQAVYWLVTEEPILEESQSQTIRRGKLMPADEVAKAEEALLVALCNGLLEAYGKKTSFELTTDANGNHFSDDTDTNWWNRDGVEKISAEEWNWSAEFHGSVWKDNLMFWFDGPDEPCGYHRIGVRTYDLYRCFNVKHPNFERANSEGGKNVKFIQELQKFIDEVAQSLFDDNKGKITNGKFLDFMEDYTSTDPYERSGKCDFLFIDGDALCWRQDDGPAGDLKLVSLGPYFKRANAEISK